MNVIYTLGMLGVTVLGNNTRFLANGCGSSQALLPRMSKNVKSLFTFTLAGRVKLIGSKSR